MIFSNFARLGFAVLTTLGLLSSSPALYAKDGSVTPIIKLSSLPDIKAGMSEAEVDNLLGHPNNKPKWLNGTTTWTYDTDDWKLRYDVDFGTDGKVFKTQIYQRASSGNT